MIAAVAVAPALIAAVWTALFGARRAIVGAVLPALLLLPNYYTWKLPGVPRFDFHGYMLLFAAGALVVAQRAMPRFHPIDLLIAGYILLVTWSEYENKGFGEARNLFALSLMGIAAPYILGKSIAVEGRLTVASLGMLVLIGSLIGAASVYEARMGTNPFDFWRRLWPTAVPWDGALYRAGIRRVAGPFAHPICHGFFFSLALPVGAWLIADKLALRPLGRLALLGGLTVGLLTSVSRGPIMGLLIASGVILFGWSHRRAALLVAGGFVALLLAVLLFDQVQGYVSVTRGEAVTATQETAAYRNEMLQNYLEVVGESPVLGFGKDQIPIIKGQKSIDNQYLFLALSHGLPASIVFLLLMLAPILASLARLLAGDRRSSRSRLHWVLVGALTGAIFTQITVFSGTQTTQVLLLFIGLCVGLLLPVSGCDSGQGRASI